MRPNWVLWFQTRFIKLLTILFRPTIASTFSSWARSPYQSLLQNGHCHLQKTTYSNRIQGYRAVSIVAIWTEHFQRFQCYSRRWDYLRQRMISIKYSSSRFCGSFQVAWIVQNQFTFLGAGSKVLGASNNRRLIADLLSTAFWRLFFGCISIVDWRSDKDPVRSKTLPTISNSANEQFARSFERR